MYNYYTMIYFTANIIIVTKLNILYTNHIKYSLTDSKTITYSKLLPRPNRSKTIRTNGCGLNYARAVTAGH